MDKLCTMFSLFSVTHFVYMFVAIFLAVVLFFALKSAEGKARNIFSIVLISVMGLMIILEYVGIIIEFEDFNFLENMPINIHQVFVYICIYLLIVKESSWSKFAYLIMLPICCYELMFVPNRYMLLGEVSLGLIGFVVSNICIIVYSLLKHIWAEDYIGHKDVLNSTINWIIIFSIGHLVNVLLQMTGWGLACNYFGTMGSEYDLLIGWLGSIINIPYLCIIPCLAVLVGVEYLLLLPSKLIKERRESREQLNELIALGNLKAQQAHRDKERRRKERSQILIRGEGKASPSTPKNQYNNTKSGFVSVNKVIKTDNKEE